LLGGQFSSSQIGAQSHMRYCCATHSSCLPHQEGTRFPISLVWYLPALC